jgi:hypothetical protein
MNLLVILASWISIILLTPMQTRQHKVLRNPPQYLPKPQLSTLKQARKGLFCYTAFGRERNKY